MLEKGWETIEWEIEVKPNWLVDAGGDLRAQHKHLKHVFNIEKQNLIILS